MKVPARHTINVLQAGRALAALAVVSVHAAQTTESFSGPLPRWFFAIVWRGYLGVDFFFVLSGFIIYHISKDAEPSREWAGRFLKSRAIRVYIPYLPIGIAMALLYTLFPGLSAGDRVWDWYSSLTLLPSTAMPALGVAWTLRHEVLFYGIFLVAFMLRRPIAGCAIWATVCGVLSAAFPGFAASTPFSYINIEFLFGVIVAWGWTRIGIPTAIAAGILVLCVFIARGAVVEDRLIFGLAMAFLIVAAVNAERNGLRTPAALLFLGNASYAIYLVHDPVISAMGRLHLPPLIGFTACVLAGVSVGIVYRLAWEIPALTVASGIRQRASAPAAP